MGCGGPSKLADPVGPPKKPTPKSSSSAAAAPNNNNKRITTSSTIAPPPPTTSTVPSGSQKAKSAVASGKQASGIKQHKRKNGHASGGRGGSNSNANAQLGPPSTRTRSDTWEQPEIGDEELAAAILESTKSAMSTIRIDSSSPPQPPPPPSPLTTLQQQQQQQELIVQQWKMLWERHAPFLVDPADVVSVVDELTSKCVNLLSPVQLLQLQRRIRHVVVGTPTQNSNTNTTNTATTGNKIVAKVFSGGSHHNNNNNVSSGSTSAASASPEERALLQQHRLLSPTLLQRILPPCSSVTDSIILLMSALTASDVLLERARWAAADAARAVKVELDVNQQILAATKNSKSSTAPPLLPMPKPSQIPVLRDPVTEWPAGASLPAVAAILGLAVSGTRRQKLQLLFYMLMDCDVLQDFLATHPAGGIPVWLLEVGHPVVTSLPALTHYHYYGNAFSPSISGSSVGDGSTTSSSHRASPPAQFYASKSRLPVTIDPQRTLQIIAEALLHAAGVSNVEEEEEDTTTNARSKAVSLIQFPVSEPVSKLLKDSVTIIGGTTSSSNNYYNNGGGANLRSDPSSTLFRRQASPPAMDGTSSNPNGGGSELWYGSSTSSVTSPVTRLLQQVADHQQQDLYASQHHKTELDQSVHWFEAAVAKFFAQSVQQGSKSSSSSNAWTLHDFDRWSASALDDLALHIVLHRLLGEGILASPALERDLVWQAWTQWQSDLDRKQWLADDGMLPALKDSQSVTDMISSSVAALMGSWNNNNNDESNITTARPPPPPPQWQLRAVWGGVGNVDGGGGAGFGVLYCVPTPWWKSWCQYTGWSFVGDLPKPAQPHRPPRPGTLHTESLLWSGGAIPHRGSAGSYEVMRNDVQRGRDYVLIPPPVWDVLFELYGGGPPLPRMVQAPTSMQSSSSISKTNTHHHYHPHHHHHAPVIQRAPMARITSVDPPEASDAHFEEPRRSIVSNDADVVDQVMGEIMMQQSGSSVGDRLSVLSQQQLRVMRIPERIQVVAHPWLLHVQLCDPLQPYRRGDYAPLSIRVMVAPSQPLWRLLSECLLRFPTVATGFRALDSATNQGRVRLWKRVDVAAAANNNNPAGTAAARYGPWNLLCHHGRHAVLPLFSHLSDEVPAPALPALPDLITNWKAYAGDDTTTVECAGLHDQDNLLLEFAVLNKNGELTWPREAAAKAGKVRQLAEEDLLFRQKLEGLDEQGNILLKPPDLVGMEVDAMEASGRWYTLQILAVEVVDDEDTETSEEDDDDDEEGLGDKSRHSSEQKKDRSVARKKVKVNFKEHGGHYEWIDIASDRLQTAGRFASETEQQQATATSATKDTAENTARSRSTASAKGGRTNSNAENSTSNGDNTKSCALPGFGSCGLTNLGNTCYVNAAVQCLAYIPLLRAYLLSAQYKATGDLNKDNAPFGTNGQLLLEFAELFKQMWSTRLAEKSPNRFKTQLGKFNGQFVGVDQQDAQEFLTYIIDMLHEDSNKVRKKPYVENPEDRWKDQATLPRIAIEAWRRFLRRNRSIMADVLMGQELNTVTCPTCNYSSHKFDPFNVLSIPIPTIADVVFQCTVIRRATASNCPFILNKARKNDKRAVRFPNRMLSDNRSTGPPAETFVTESYMIALSRLADGGDIRLQLQNLCGIRASRMRLCRVEEVTNDHPSDNSATQRHIKCFPLSEKDGPASQYAKKRGNDEDISKTPTQIIAFEFTINTRRVDDKMGKSGGSASSANLDDTGDENDENEAGGIEEYPSPAEKAIIDKYLAIYGDEKECRLLDTDPVVLAKAVSRSLWPRSDAELKLGLRVDAKDHRGNWFPGSVVDISEEEIKASDADTGQEVALRQKKVRIHFDNFLPKWDEVYSIDHFKKGRVNPLYSHAEPKGKATEFLVHHRFTTRGAGSPYSPLFGHSFYIQCQNEWTNARAGAHVLAQVSRFLQQNPAAQQDPHHVIEKAQTAISELIDLLVDCDREFVRMALGVSKHSSEREGSRPYRNPSFDPTAFDIATNTKVQALLHRLPFEVRLCTLESTNSEKAINNEEVGFPFSLIRTIGNFVSIRNAIVLHWREPPVDKKNGTQKISTSSVLYADPVVHRHEASYEILKNDKIDGQILPGGGGIDLGFCLTEFCKVQKLLWKCPRCKENRESGQNTNLWRLPDVLTIHIKRFNMSARWHEKITTKVDYPLTGLDMSKWCHKESPVLWEEPEDSYIYDLIGVVNHYGSSMTGGHYIAVCKASLCGKDGKEEVAYNFNGAGTTVFEAGSPDEPTGWGLGRAKTKVNQSKVEAEVFSKAVADSAEPMWLQFDDEVVEPISPKQVISEMAYVLFYRRRRITPSNIAKYCTLE